MAEEGEKGEEKEDEERRMRREKRRQRRRLSSRPLPGKYASHWQKTEPTSSRKTLGELGH